MRTAEFWRRISDRRVVQWALGYVAGAWILLEFTDFLAGEFGWPGSIVRVMLVALAAGFLATLVISWFHGDKGHQQVTRTEVILLTAIGVTGLAVAVQVARMTTAAAAAAAVEARPAVPVELRDGVGIAVLPFLNLSADPDNEYFSDGVTEDIIAELSRVPGLRVISRTSVMTYKNTEKSVPQIAQELGVSVILEGSVRRSGDQVRIVAQLIDAATDEHLWSATYDRDIRNILEIQSDVARQIAGALAATLGEPQLALADAPVAAEAVDPDAYSMYLRGRQLARAEDAENRGRAVELLSQAIELDSTFEPAWGALAEAIIPTSFDTAIGAVEQQTRALQLLEHRLDRVGARPDVLTSVMIRRVAEGLDIRAAADSVRRAVERSPNYMEARRWHGLLLARQGRPEQGLEQLREAQRLDPLNPSIGTEIGEILYALGRDDDAVTQLHAVLGHSPGHVPARIVLGLALHGRGEGEAAIAELRRAVDESRGDPIARGSLGYVLAREGRTEQARAILAALSAGPARGSVPLAIAHVYAGLGMTDSAAHWLGRARESRSPVLFGPRWVRAFDALRDDPRFRRLLAMDAPAPPQPGRREPPSVPRSTVRD
jgi:TolB-like protein/Flp pilus assembly protein TadD